MRLHENFITLLCIQICAHGFMLLFHLLECTVLYPVHVCMMTPLFISYQSRFSLFLSFSLLPSVSIYLSGLPQKLLNILFMHAKRVNYIISISVIHAHIHIYTTLIFQSNFTYAFIIIFLLNMPFSLRFLFYNIFGDAVI